MKIAIKATKFELTPLIRKTIEEKIEPLAKLIFYPEDVIKFFVEVGLETKHHKKGHIYYAEISLKIPGKVFYFKAKKEDLYQAINEVKKELQTALRKEKEKRITRKKRN